MVIHERFYSAEDLWELSHSADYAGQRLELIEGMLLVMSPAGGEHGGLAVTFAVEVGGFVKANHLGYCTVAETGYLLYKNPNGRDVVLAPDFAFVAGHRLPEGLPKKYIPLAPDLAVEIVSPNDTASEIHDKVTTYLKYGTKMVWVAYPSSRTVAVHTQAGAKTLGVGDTLDGGTALPGFSLGISEIFGN
jgi:Uma2 family endonuclease